MEKMVSIQTKNKKQSIIMCRLLEIELNQTITSCEN